MRPGGTAILLAELMDISTLLDNYSATSLGKVYENVAMCSEKIINLNKSDANETSFARQLYFRCFFTFLNNIKFFSIKNIIFWIHYTVWFAVDNSDVVLFLGKMTLIICRDDLYYCGRIVCLWVWI